MKKSQQPKETIYDPDLNPNFFSTLYVYVCVYIYMYMCVCVCACVCVCVFNTILTRNSDHFPVQHQTVDLGTG